MRDWEWKLDAGVYTSKEKAAAEQGSETPTKLKPRATSMIIFASLWQIPTHRLICFGPHAPPRLSLDLIFLFITRQHDKYKTDDTLPRYSIRLQCVSSQHHPAFLDRPYVLSMHSCIINHYMAVASHLDYRYERREVFTLRLALER
jgi:hypothetical protein